MPVKVMAESMSNKYWEDEYFSQFYIFHAKNEKESAKNATLKRKTFITS